MNLDRNTVYIVVALLGVFVGLGVSSVGGDESYCNSIEQGIQENRSFNGSIGCYPPGVIDANLSDRVQNASELRCVCRVIDRNGVRIFPVAMSN